jgi:hypothetical protein
MGAMLAEAPLLLLGILGVLIIIIASWLLDTPASLTNNSLFLLNSILLQSLFRDLMQRYVAKVLAQASNHFGR